jgi:hypothetical protein
MTRTFLPRALGGAGIVAALVAAVTMFAGSGLAQGSAAQANYAPANTAAPTISGSPQVGQVLTAANGTWASDTTPTYAYVWQQCDAQGNGCAAISGATAATHTVQTAAVGKTIRVVVTATNPTGPSSATSAQTAVVTQATAATTAGPAGAIKLSNGQTSIPATSVGLPERLIVDSVKFTPGRLTNRAAFVGRFHVADTRGNVVRDALVKVTALPYAWARSGTEVRTDQAGWATLTVTPTVNMPLGRNALVMFVRARVEGQSLLAGSSSRRLVQITIR